MVCDTSLKLNVIFQSLPFIACELRQGLFIYLFICYNNCEEDYPLYISYVTHMQDEKEKDRP